MCIAIFKPAKKHIEKKKLRRSFAANPDGAGFMYISSGSLIIDKGYFSFCSFYKAYRNAERLYPGSNFVIHFRIGTSGKLNSNNCHPIRIKENLAYVHNGVLSSIHIPKDSKVSDTVLFAQQILSKLPMNWHKKNCYRSLVETYAEANHSSFILMSEDSTVLIFNEAKGIWDNDIWYSNKTYQNTTFGFSNKWDTDFMLEHKSDESYCSFCFCPLRSGEYDIDPLTQKKYCIDCLIANYEPIFNK